MYHKRIHVLAICFLLLALVLTGCGGAATNAQNGNAIHTGMLDPQKKYTVNFWEAFATGANKTTLANLTGQYMHVHPDVMVDLQAFDSYDTLQTKLRAAIAAGNPPALAQVYEEWATQFQQAHALTSLQPFISGKNGLSQSDLADFYPAMLQDGQIGGTQYMLPFNKSDIALYYNVDILQKYGLQPPKTFQEFTADVTKVTNSSQWGLSYTPDVDLWSILYKSLGGGDFVAPDGLSVAFANGKSQQAATQAFGMLAPYVKLGAIHVTTGYNWQNDFASQKSAFAIATIASYPFLASSIGNHFQFAEAPMPAGPAGQFTVLYGTNLAIFAGANQDAQTAAWDYLKFLTSTQANATFVQGTGYMPVRRSTFNSSALQRYYSKAPARKVGPQQLGSAFVASTVPAWDQCRNIISTSFTGTLSGQSTENNALNKVVQQCNFALAQG